MVKCFAGRNVRLASFHLVGAEYHRHVAKVPHIEEDMPLRWHGRRGYVSSMRPLFPSFTFIEKVAAASEEREDSPRPTDA